MKTTIYKIVPFDASIGTIIKFSWNGNQIFKNRCIIKRNDTDAIVYDNTVESFKLEHSIDLSKATLENGMRYNAFITVFDRDNNESDMQSLGEGFLCLKTPVFNFSNTVEGQVISSSSYEFSLIFSQENGELLDSWSISVYTKSDTLLATSGIKYDTNELRYYFSGFSNKTEYKIRAIGQTINGMPLDSGFINISSTFDIAEIFSVLESTNLSDIGAIKIRCNAISSEGHLQKEPGIYIDNEYLDLRDNKVVYSEGFLFGSSFSFITLFYGTQPNQTIISMFGENKDELTLSITYRIGRFGSNDMLGCFELLCTSNGIESVIYSNNIPMPTDTDKIGLCLTKKEGLYDLEITNLGRVGGQ